MSHDRTKLYIQDVTLRDGMHAIRHQYSVEHVRAIARRSTRPGSTPSRSRTATAWPGSQLQLRLRRAHRLGVDRGGGRGRHARQADHAAAARHRHHPRPRSAPTTLGVRSCGSPPTAPRPTSPSSTSSYARELGMDVSGFLMMSHMNAPQAAGPAGQADGELRRALRATSPTRGGALTMDDVRARFHAYKRVLKPETETRHPRPPQPEPGRRQLDRRRRGRLRSASTPVLAGMGAGAGNAPLEVFIAAADRLGWEHGMRPVQADGRGRRPGAAAAGPAGARRPRDADARLCRRVLAASCATPRRQPQTYGLDTRDILVELGTAAHGRRPGGHDRRRRARSLEPLKVRSGRQVSCQRRPAGRPPGAWPQTPRGTPRRSTWDPPSAADRTAARTTVIARRPAATSTSIGAERDAAPASSSSCSTIGSPGSVSITSSASPSRSRTSRPWASTSGFVHAR